MAGIYRSIAGTRRRMLARAGAGLALTAVGAACEGGSGGGHLAEPSKTAVTIRAFIGGLSATMLDRWSAEMAEPFKRQRPNVTIEVLNQDAAVGGVTASGTTGVVQKLIALMAGGDPPDVNDLPRPARWQVPNGILDEQLDGFVKRDKYDTKQFNQREFANRGVYQNKVWQIPYRVGGNAVMVVCNRSMFMADGVAVPSSDPAKMWDWNAYVDTMTRLTKRPAGTPTQIGMMSSGNAVYTWPLQWQTDFVTADGKTVVCDSADMQDCYTKFADNYQRLRVILAPAEATSVFGAGNLFLKGQAAMVVSNVGSIKTYLAQDQVRDVTLAPIPKVKISSADMNASCLGIVKGSKHQADAWDAIKYFNDGSRLALYTDRPPAVLKDVDPWAKQLASKFPNADYKVIVRAIETHVPQLNLAGLKYIDDILAILNPAMDGLMAGKEAAVPMLKRLKPELQGMVDRP